jgi:hypothetical protein
MTFGIYSGETKIDHRARWLVKAIRYPSVTHGHHPEPDQTDDPGAVLAPSGQLPSG